jgi:hypothetical protein
MSIKGADACFLYDFLGRARNVLRGLDTGNRKFALRKHVIKKLLKMLERFRVQYINGKKIIYPLTSEQKNIFDVFGIHYPI